MDVQLDGKSVRTELPMRNLVPLQEGGDHLVEINSLCNATLSVTTLFFIDVPENGNSTLKMEFLVPNTMHSKEGMILQQEVRITNSGEAMGMVTAVVGLG